VGEINKSFSILLIGTLFVASVILLLDLEQFYGDFIAMNF